MCAGEDSMLLAKQALAIVVAVAMAAVTYGLQRIGLRSRTSGGCGLAMNARGTCIFVRHGEVLAHHCLLMHTLSVTQTPDVHILHMLHALCMQATWNQENRFIGWTDVPLTARGIEEAQMAARTLRESGLTIDTVYTSYLKRAIQSTNEILLEMDQAWLPVVRPHKHAC
jgi:hypothetical protein